MTTPAAPIAWFAVWQAGYGGATVEIVKAGTTAPALVYADYLLTTAAENPQILDTRTVNGIAYGKFARPIYCPEPYDLIIDGAGRVGIVRPGLVSLKDENANTAVATTNRGRRFRRLQDRFDDVVHAEDFGLLGDSSATNTATINAAIGAASSQGGGAVIIPAGTHRITTVTIPQNVRLVGESRAGTVLQSEEAQAVITLSGARAGLEHLTLDGVSLIVGSIGVYSKANDQITFRDVQIKRFDTGMQFYGGRHGIWRDLHIDNCTIGAELRGDTDPSGGADGDEFSHLHWSVGSVTQCTTAGVLLTYEDRFVRHNMIQGVRWQDNTGTALKIKGARWTGVRESDWSGNTVNLHVEDDADASKVAENTVVGVTITDSQINGGTCDFTDTTQQTRFERTALEGVTLNMDNPANSIVLIDCVEDAAVAIANDGTKVTRWTSQNQFTLTGQTTDATTTNAWTYALGHGQPVYLEASVMARQLNGDNIAHYKKAVKASRPGAHLDYDNQTADFTVGETLTGGTSGATAVIQADSDKGTSGTLTLCNLSGDFENNETITDDSGGSAQVHGPLTGRNAVIDQADTIGTDHEDVSGYTVAWAVSNAELQLQVTGAASATLDWFIKIDGHLP